MAFMKRLTLAFFAAAGIVYVQPVTAKEPPPWINDIQVSLEAQTDDVKNAKATLSNSLAGVVPSKGQHMITTSDGRCILLGDLFGNNKRYALVELSHLGKAAHDDIAGSSIGVGFSVWNGKQWDTRGLWKINSIWRPQGWEKSGDDYFPIPPATRPFWILNVKPNDPPLVIIVGDIWKYWQEHFIARLDQAKDTLIFLEQTKKADVVHGYLKLHSDSGHRATFQAWQFCRWTGKDIIPFAYWYEGVDQSEEHQMLIATTYDDKGEVSDTYKIDNSDQADSYSITRNEQPYAKVKIDRPNAPNVSDESEDAYFFRKLTGLPLDLYPNGFPGAKPKLLEKIAKISVTGDPDAVKRLGNNRK